MLYDPKWEQQTKAEPFSLDSLIAWLEKQPENDSYPFCEWNNCLLAQWLREADSSARCVGGERGPNGYYMDGFSYRANGRIVDLRHLMYVAAGDDYERDNTYGAALERARALRT